MPLDVKKNLKKSVIALRRKGFSFGKIRQQFYIPKSTLSLWTRGINLTGEQLKKNLERRTLIARKNGMDLAKRFANEKFKVKHDARVSIKRITRKEFWLMGLMLYWGQNKKNQIVQFSSGRPDHIEIFLRWLQIIGKIRKKEIMFSIILKNKDDSEYAHKFWSHVVAFGKDFHPRIYYKKQQGDKRNTKSNSKGILILRVRSSALLAQQISGWLEGIGMLNHADII